MTREVICTRFQPRDVDPRLGKKRFEALRGPFDENRAAGGWPNPPALDYDVVMSEAHEAITKLIYTYAELMDAADFEGIGRLFAHAVMTAEGVPDVRRGAEEITRQYVESARVFPDTGTPKTKHVTTNLIIDVDEAAGTATARSYFTVFQQTDTLPLQPIIAGRYHDTFERADGQWRFTRRHMICDLIGDLSQHLLFDLASVLPTKG